MKKALLYEKKNDSVKCLLCAHQCQLKEDKLGICGVRKNIAGDLYSLNYEKVAATHADPIEKKPLYHFLPASTAFSVATMGCNFKCTFCQNNSLSVVEEECQISGKKMSPEELVAIARHYGAQSISYTYSEPTVFFELMLETAQLAREEGLRNTMVSNGYISAPGLEMLAEYMDGANIDLKAFSDDFYVKQCGAKLQPVLDTIRRMKERGIWLEITTLLIPGLNSDKEEIKKLIAFILEVDENIPWHVSRFFPQHHLTEVESTPQDLIYEVLEVATQMGLKYIYAGNVADDRYSHTHCPQCQSTLVTRLGYSTSILNLSDGLCINCQTEIPGVW